MATWGAGPLDNEVAMDFFSRLVSLGASSSSKTILGVLQEALSPLSPLVTGQPVLVPIEEENLKALVAAIGSIDNVVELVGGVQKGAVLYMRDQGIALAQQAYLASAIVLASLQDDLDCSDELIRVSKKVTWKDPSSVRKIALSCVSAILTNESIVLGWTEVEDERNAVSREIRERLSRMERSLSNQ